MLEKAGGNWVDDKRFFDREAELDALTERARSRTHTLLTAQRRMDKTSLVRETLRRLAETGEFEAVFVDLEHAADAADAIAEIGIRTRPAGDLWGRVAPLFAPLKAFGERIEEVGIADARVKLRAGIDAGSWRRDGERIFEALAAHDRPVALAIDELPILVNRLLNAPEGRPVAELFLSFLRKNAQARKGRVVIIVSGSVGLEPILRRARLSAHANVFPRYELKPWTEEVASACLAALAQRYGVGLPEEARRGMYRRLRCCVPHHVQQFFDLLHEDLRRRRRRDAGSSDVERVYRDNMLGTAGQIHLDHYEQRLRVRFGISHCFFWRVSLHSRIWTLPRKSHVWAVAIVASKSLANRRLRPSHASVRSTAQRRGDISNPCPDGARFTTSSRQRILPSRAVASFGRASEPSAKMRSRHGNRCRIEASNSGAPLRS